MAPPLRLDYAVNDADVIAAFKRQQAEIEKERKSRQELEKQINSNAAAQKTADKQALESSKKLQAEQAKLAADAAKLSEAARTPMQTYKQGLAELVDHYRSGRISQDVYRASVDKLKESYDQATGKTERAKEALRLSNEETKEAKRIIDALKTPQQQYIERVGRIEKLHASGKLSSREYTAAIAAEKKQLAETGEAADKSGGMIGGLTGKMAGFVGGLTSASAVIALLKSEYDALIERQGRSRDAHLSLAVEQEALLMNLGDASAKDVTEKIRSLSQSSGAKEVDVTRAVNEALAARADLSLESVISAVGTASKVRKFAPTELAGLAAATIDTQKQTGLGTDQALGFLMQLQAQSRTKSLKGLAENFTPAVGGVMNFGADRQTAGAMLAALSHGMGDATGAQTGTSAIQLAKQLREYGIKGDPALAAKFELLDKRQSEEKAALAEEFHNRGIARDSMAANPQVKAELRWKLAAEEKIAKEEMKARHSEEAAKLQDAQKAIPIADVIAKMRQNPEYRKQFLKGKDEGGFGASFEAKALPAIESLLSGGTQAKQFDTARAALAQDPEQALKKAIGNRDLISMKVAGSDQNFGNMIDQFMLSDDQAAMAAVVRNRLEQTRNAIGGRSRISNNLDSMKDDFRAGGQQSIESAIVSLEGLRSSFDSQEKRDAAWAFHNRGGNLRTEQGKQQFENEFSQTAAGKQQALLQMLIDELKGLREDGKNGAHAGILANRAAENREGR